jgi:copper chaperone CopZ
MTCGNCARSVERTLRATPGVSNATVDLQGASATVLYDPGVVKPAALVEAVCDLGYQAAI